MVLFSSQHQQFRPAQRELGLFQAIFEEVTYKELKHMAQSQYAVTPEGYEELHKWFLQSLLEDAVSVGLLALAGAAQEDGLAGAGGTQRLDAQVVDLFA